MKIVIDIPEETYRSIIKSDIEVEFYRSEDMFCNNPISIMLALRTGKVLPKGHGRLIDADKFISEHFGKVARLVDDAPTIIEADQEGAENGTC